MALTVFVPAAVELNDPVICPPVLVVPTGCVTVLPVAGAPGTGLANWSRTIPDGGVATAVPTVATWSLPAFNAISLAAPAVPVAVKATGLPVRPAEVAVREFDRAVVLSVQEVSAATPLAFVRMGVVGLTLPLPAAGANVTATPATGLLNWSRTITAGGVATAVPTVAVWWSPALGAIDAAAAAVTLN